MGLFSHEVDSHSAHELESWIPTSQPYKKSRRPARPADLVPAKQRSPAADAAICVQGRCRLPVPCARCFRVQRRRRRAEHDTDGPEIVVNDRRRDARSRFVTMGVIGSLHQSPARPVGCSLACLVTCMRWWI